MACKIGKILVSLIIVGLLWILDAFLLGSIDPNVTNGFFCRLLARNGCRTKFHLVLV
jgi:hypothetical protein